MVKVKLIYVPRYYSGGKFGFGYSRSHTFTPPLGISILTSLLKKFDIYVKQDDLDARIFFNNPETREDLKVFDDKARIEAFLDTAYDSELERRAEKMLEKTEIKGYDLIGLSLCGQHNFSVIGTCVVLAKLIKEKTGAKIIVGGVDKNECMIEFSKLVDFDYIDFVVSSKGEEALLNICLELENTGEVDLKMDNLFYVGMKDADKKPKINIQPWNDLLKPDFDGLPLDLYRYNPYEEYEDLNPSFETNLRILMLPYAFTYGCPNNCAFCSEYENNFTYKKIQDVIEDLKFLKERYNTKYFFFLVNNINPWYNYAEELADEIVNQDLDIMWTACANFSNMDKNLLHKFKLSGAVRLIYGLETASNKLLKYVLKGFTREKARKMLEISDKFGIWNEIEMISGLPFERTDDIKTSKDFISQNKDYINSCHLNKFMLKKSLFLKFPERFGLTNTSRISRPFYFYRFDEINGLKWAEKVKQIEDSYNELHTVINNEFHSKGWKYYRPSSNFPFLLYFYAVIGNKDEVESIVYSNTEFGV